MLALLGRGMANKRIAQELGISEKTVKIHVSRVLHKLGVADRTQAALLAVKEGLGVGRWAYAQLPMVAGARRA